MDMTSYWISCAGLLGSCVAYWIGLIVGNREGRADLEHEIRLYGGAVKHVDICSRCAHITDLGLSSIPYAVAHEQLEVKRMRLKKKEKKIADGWHFVKCEHRTITNVTVAGVPTGVRIVLRSVEYKDGCQVQVCYGVEEQSTDSACAKFWNLSDKLYVTRHGVSRSSYCFDKAYTGWLSAVISPLFPYVTVPVEHLEVK